MLQIFGHFPMRLAVLAVFLITRSTAITVVSWPVEGCSVAIGLGSSLQLKNQKSRRLARPFVVDDVLEAQLGLGISALGDFVPWLCALCHS
ncbi:hypothetical protein FVEG_15059 [Fusarium verticillioides 7600]|uniref:Secreted protein n=1 Tax=Gibberella moniliformis (strain M3125 / FGSC 7600) TaxID=334819 RepID=W7LW28_GIBM7|nr:hypothetical protein FVEG_15059 [Fusarium verticillioides 7600]EWG39695.1 hypothetical protein FVEG_15059 [Fusarium verticillioides 7600]